MPLSDSGRLTVPTGDSWIRQKRNIEHMLVQMFLGFRNHGAFVNERHLAKTGMVALGKTDASHLIPEAHECYLDVDKKRSFDWKEDLWDYFKTRRVTRKKGEDDDEVLVTRDTDEYDPSSKIIAYWM